MLTRAFMAAVWSVHWGRCSEQYESAKANPSLYRTIVAFAVRNIGAFRKIADLPEGSRRRIITRYRLTDGAPPVTIFTPFLLCDDRIGNRLWLCFNVDNCNRPTNALLFSCTRLLTANEIASWYLFELVRPWYGYRARLLLYIFICHYGVFFIITVHFPVWLLFISLCYYSWFPCYSSSFSYAIILITIYKIFSVFFSCTVHFYFILALRPYLRLNFAYICFCNIW